MRRFELQRRRLVCGLFAASAWVATRRASADAPDVAAARSSHFPFGPVVPARPIPAWGVETHTGVRTQLPLLLKGRVSALQLMFTGCNATCPIQGALFSQAQRALPKTGDFQLLSISIAPAADTPQALSAWLGDFSAAPGWLALRPKHEDLEPMFDLLSRGGEARPKGPDPHNGQVYLVDRSGALVYRTSSLPPAMQIVEAMKTIAINV